MASVYTILFKDTTDNRKIKKKVDELSTEKGSSKDRIIGAEATRYMRPLNSVMNKVTNGYWEQGTRLVKSGINVGQNYVDGGLGQAMGSVGVMIIVQYVVLQIMKWWDKEKELAKSENNANFLRMETGQSRLSDSHSVSKKLWNGKITYSDQ